MDDEGEASASSPFAPKSALVRTPPSGFSATPGTSAAGTADLTPASTRPPRPPPPLSPPAPTTATKRPLTSPEERRPVEVVRICRPTDDEAGSAAAGPSTRPTLTLPPGPAPSSGPTTPDAYLSAHEASFEEEATLARATKLELLDAVHRELRVVMSAVTGPTSKLNKEATNNISSSVQNVLAVVAALSLRLSEQEVSVSEANLKVARLELEVVRARTSPQAGAPTTGSTFSYASALKISRRAEPVPIPAAQGPVLAFYPAPEHAASFKTAEDTKAELKKCVKPQDMQVQVDRLRKVGNAGVVVQTTSEASAEKLKKAAPATLRVTEPKRRAPLVSLRHVDGEGELEGVLAALYDQNYRGSEWTLERLKAQSKLAFKKRGRGTTTVVLECSPQLREALLSKERVYIGWQVIEVVDFLSVTCCRKCHQYGHPEKYCRATDVFCGRCGGSGHRGEDCTSQTESCATCKRFGKPEASTHATASGACPARQYAEARSVSNTNYGR